MDDKLIEEAKKHKVPLRTRAGASLPYSQNYSFSAKELVEAIQAFLNKHNLEDADLYLECSGYDGYIDEFRINADVARTEEEIRKDIANKKLKDSEKRKKDKAQREARKAEELATYERLHKKYGNKPVGIDYPEDRTRLKEEFGKIASRPGFKESVEKAKEMLAGVPKKRKKKEPEQTHCLPGKHLGIGLGHDVCEVCGKNTYS